MQEALDAALIVGNMISVSLLNASIFSRKNEFGEELAGRARRRRARRRVFGIGACGLFF
jgi:hypothetical protein